MKGYNLLHLKTRTSVLIFLNIALLFLLLFAKCEKVGPFERRAVNIRLLSLAMLKDAKEIILREPGIDGSAVSSGSLRIIKEEPAWILKEQYSSYYVKKDLIESFLSALTREVDAYFITNEYRDYAYYKLDEASSFSVRLIGSDGSVLQDIYFGAKDESGQRRYARRGNIASSVFSILDFAHPFLSASSTFWVDMQVYKEKLKRNNITYIENSKNEKIFRKDVNEEGFLALERTLSNLTMINTFDGLNRENENTIKFTFGMEVGEPFGISITELDGGDYIFFDNVSKSTYVLSAYSKKRFLEALDALDASE